MIAFLIYDNVIFDMTTSSPKFLQILKMQGEDYYCAKFQLSNLFQ